MWSVPPLVFICSKWGRLSCRYGKHTWHYYNVYIASLCPSFPGTSASSILFGWAHFWSRFRCLQNISLGSSTYTSAKFYNFIFEQAPKDPMLQSIWKSKSLPKLSLFLDLDEGSVEYERPDASQALEYLGWSNMYYLLISWSTETRDHLFFQCSFVVSCWQCIDI
jgi:hypothetical protein